MPPRHALYAMGEAWFAVVPWVAPKRRPGPEKTLFLIHGAV